MILLNELCCMKIFIKNDKSCINLK